MIVVGLSAADDTGADDDGWALVTCDELGIGVELSSWLDDGFGASEVTAAVE